MSMRIGFAGLGIMGEPMSLNLLKAGYEVAVYNRSPEKCAPLAEAGASVAGTPRELARDAEVLVLMLTGPEAIDAVLFGPDGAAKGLEPGRTVVNMSSVGPAYAKDLAARLEGLGVAAVDAPVAGSRKPAEEGDLVILAGGPDRAVDAVEPVLLAMGKKVVRCGPAGSGAAMKMANNILLGTMTAGLAQFMRFGEAAGLSRQALLAVLAGGPMSCALFDMKAALYEAGEFSPQFPLKHMAKDLRFAREAAERFALPDGFIKAVLDPYQRAEDRGLGEKDFAAVYEVLGKA